MHVFIFSSFCYFTMSCMYLSQSIHDVLLLCNKICFAADTCEAPQTINVTSGQSVTINCTQSCVDHTTVHWTNENGVSLLNPQREDIMEVGDADTGSCHDTGATNITRRLRINVTNRTVDIQRIQCVADLTEGGSQCITSVSLSVLDPTSKFTMT